MLPLPAANNLEKNFAEVIRVEPFHVTEMDKINEYFCEEFVSEMSEDCRNNIMHKNNKSRCLILYFLIFMFFVLI